MNVNNVVLVGRIIKDVEMIMTQNGKQIAKFTIAVNRTKKKQDGHYESDILNVVAFDQTATFVSQYTGKGSIVAVQGRIQTGSYDKQDGTRVYTTDIMAMSVTNLSPRDNSQQNNGMNNTSANINTQYQNQAPGFQQQKDGYQPAPQPGQTYQQTYQAPVYNQQPQVNGQQIPQGLQDGVITEDDLPF